MNEVLLQPMLALVSLAFFPYCYLETGFYSDSSPPTHTVRSELAVQTASVDGGGGSVTWDTSCDVWSSQSPGNHWLAGDKMKVGQRALDSQRVLWNKGLLLLTEEWRVFCYTLLSAA